MESLKDRATPYNFPEIRQTLWKEKNPNEIRNWIKDAINPETKLFQLYRMHRQDVDTDVAWAAQYFVTSSAAEQPDCQFGLRLMWRFLLRNYAFFAAFRISTALGCMGEPWIWRFWRWKDLFLWRLAMSVLAGFLLLSASSLLFEILKAAAGSARHSWLLALPPVVLLFVFLLAVTDVQRRIGRRSWPLIVERSALVTVIGSIYASVGGLVIHLCSGSLGMTAPPSLVVLSSATALLLGFVFHLFWEDRSIGDPL